jgi:NADH:ubiquinone oxidoreductase subunit K
MKKICTLVVLVVAAAAASVTTAITLYALWRNPEKRKQKAEKSTNNT